MSSCFRTPKKETEKVLSNSNDFERKKRDLGSKNKKNSSSDTVKNMCNTYAKMQNTVPCQVG